jgi:hypothetical protein
MMPKLQIPTIKELASILAQQTSLLAQIHWTFPAWPCILLHTYCSERLSQFSAWSPKTIKKA